MKMALIYLPSSSDNDLTKRQQTLLVNASDG